MVAGEAQSVGCRSELDEYGYRWWGVKMTDLLVLDLVDKVETVETPGGTLKRFCEPSGWGDYDGSAAASGDHGTR